MEMECDEFEIFLMDDSKKGMEKKSERNDSKISGWEEW